MWVLGDLKDQLGIPHHKRGKRDQHALEQAPMFHHPHARSESEISSFQHDVELGTAARKPSSSHSLTRQRSQSWSPHTDTQPIEEVPEESPKDFLFPSTRLQQSASPSSFRASYYSASAIPAPTPLPDIQNPNMSSVSPHVVTPQPHTQTQTSSSTRSPLTSTPEMYEMHVRPPSDTNHTMQDIHPPRGPSEATFATAYESIDDGRGTPAHQHNSSWRESTYSAYEVGQAM